MVACKNYPLVLTLSCDLNTRIILQLEDTCINLANKIFHFPSLTKILLVTVTFDNIWFRAKLAGEYYTCLTVFILLVV